MSFAKKSIVVTIERIGLPCSQKKLRNIGLGLRILSQ